MYAKRFGDERRETAEKKAVSQSSKARNESEVVRILNVESEYLGGEEDA